MSVTFDPNSEYLKSMAKCDFKYVYLVPVQSDGSIAYILTEDVKRARNGRVWFVGGKVESGESTLTALAREAREEASITAIRIVGCLLLPRYGNDTDIVPYFFAVCEGLIVGRRTHEGVVLTGDIGSLVHLSSGQMSDNIIMMSKYLESLSLGWVVANSEGGVSFVATEAIAKEAVIAYSLKRPLSSEENERGKHIIYRGSGVNRYNWISITKVGYEPVPRTFRSMGATSSTTVSAECSEMRCKCCNVRICEHFSSKGYCGVCYSCRHTGDCEDDHSWMESEDQRCMQCRDPGDGKKVVGDIGAGNKNGDGPSYSGDPKSALNLYCQKAFSTVPSYMTIRQGGTPHLPKWIGALRLPSGESFNTSAFGSAKDVERALARMALAELGYTCSDVGQSNDDDDVPLLPLPSSIDVPVQQTVLPPLLAAPAAAKLPEFDVMKSEAAALVFVDCDNIGFIDRPVVEKYHRSSFRLYRSFGRNMPFVDHAAKCRNTVAIEAPTNASDLVDVMMIRDIVLAMLSPDSSRRVFLLSGDKLLHNVEILYPSVKLVMKKADFEAEMEKITE